MSRHKNTDRLPLQKLLENDFLSVIPLHEDLHELSVVPHRHDHYEFIYITKGTGTHFINYKQYDVKPGMLYFVHPGQVHLMPRFKRKGWLIMFGSEFFERFLDIHPHEDGTGLLDLYTGSPYINLDRELKNLFEQFIVLLKAELQKKTPDSGILLHYTASLILHANRAHTAEHPRGGGIVTDRAEFHKLKQLVERHLTEHHEASFYTEALKMDIKKLNRICRASTGFTVSGLLRDRLLTESKIRLQTTSLSVKTISYDLGFNEPAFFGRFFKKYTGLTPAEFRSQRIV